MAEYNFETNENCKRAFTQKSFANCLSDFKVTWEQLKVNNSFVEVYTATIFSPLLSFPWVVQVSGRDNANEFYKFLKSARISQIKKRFGFKYSKEGYRKIS